MSPSTRQKNSSKQRAAASSGLSDREIRHARRENNVSSSSQRDAANLSSRRQTSARPQLPTNTGRSRTTIPRPAPRPTASSSSSQSNTDEDRIEHNGKNKYTAYINGTCFSFGVWSKVEKKRAENLQKLVRFKNENGFTTVPKDHHEPELHSYVKNVLHH